MNDNLPTRNNLVLLAENAASAIPNARSAAPSAAALQAAERLNRPILRLLDTGEAQLAAGAARVVPTLQPAAAAPWPCELSLDAFKLGRHGTAAVRARLARRSFDERFPAPAGCTALPAGDSVDITPLFGATPAADGVTALTLGGAVDSAAQPGARAMYLPAMEWATAEWEWPTRPKGSPAGCSGSVSAPRVVGAVATGKAHLPSAASPVASSASSSGECTFEENTDWCALSPHPRAPPLTRGNARMPASDEARPASSKEVCCGECRAAAGCKAGVFVAASGQCWLKYNIGGGKQQSPGAVSCLVTQG